MPISILPRYINNKQTEIKNFSYFFKNFTEWEEKNNTVSKPMRQIETLHERSKEILKNSAKELKIIHSFQRNVLTDMHCKGAMFSEFKAELVSPFISGLGSGHPTETGMILDRNTGLPYIPASEIKGIMRLAHALNLKDSGKTVIKQGNINEKGEFIEDKNGNQFMIDDSEPSLRKYFGDTFTDTTKKDTVRGQLVFLDAFPANIPDLKVDIMNPHYQSYYKGPEKGKENQFKGPIETESPIPIKFLTVEKGTEFIFRVFAMLLLPLTKEEEYDGVDRTFGDNDNKAVAAMFKKAFTELGFGGKTAIGYGKFSEPEPTFDKPLDEILKQLKTVEPKKETVIIKQAPKTQQDSRQSQHTKSQFSGTAAQNVKKILGQMKKKR